MAVVGQTEVEYEVFLKFADGDMEWFPMSDTRPGPTKKRFRISAV